MTVRRVLIYTTLFVLALCGGTYLALTRSGLARSMILDSLSKVFSARMQLEEAKLDPIDGKVRLENLRLSPRAKDGKVRRDALRAPEVVVGVSMNPLAGAGAVRSVRIERPELDIYLGDDSPLDLDSLLHIGGNQAAPGTLPSLQIKDMTVRLHLSDDGLVLPLGPVQLEVRPDAASPRRVALDGEFPNPFGGTIKIRGSGDVDKNEFRLLAEAEEFELSAGGLAKLGADVARFVADHELAGRVRPSLWLAYPDANGRLGGGVRTTYNNLQVRPPTFRYLLSHLSGSASLTTENGGTLEVKVDKSGTDLALSGVFRLVDLGGREELLLRATAGNVAVDRKLKDALANIPAAKRVLDAFEPANGRGDLNVFVRAGEPLPGEGDGPWTQLDLTLRDVDFTFEGLPRTIGRRIQFPYPMRRGHGRIEVRDDFVRIPSFDADGVAGGKIHVEGEADVARDHLEIKVSGKGLPLGSELRSALDRSIEGGGALFDSFAPSGHSDFELHLFQRPGMAEPSFATTLRPAGASARWEQFPFRIDDIAGSIDVTPDEVRFHLAGSRRGTSPVGRVEARARFADDEQGRTASEIHVDAKDVEVTSELRDALAKLGAGFADQWSLFEPSGSVDLEFSGWKPPETGELSFDLRADLHGVRATFAPFPVALREIRGPLVVHGDGDHTRIEVLGLTGRGLDARLLLGGLIAFDRDDSAPQVDLSVVAQGVQLKDELVDVLVDRQIITRELWDLSKATGTVDTILKIRRDAKDTDYRQELAVDLRKVTSEAELLPDKLTRLSGEVRIDEQHVIHLTNVEGYVGESKVHCEKGRIWQEGDATQMSLTLSADHYPVDDRLANLLDGDVKTAYLERRPRGHVTVEGLSMTLRVPRTPPPGASGLGLSAEFEGARFRADDLAMDLGVRVTDIAGYVVLEKGGFGPTGMRVEGQLAGLSFLAFGHQFADARGPFVATHEYFEIPRGSVHFHGGKLETLAQPGAGEPLPLVHYTLDERRHLEVALKVSAVNVERLLANAGTLQNYRGRLDGALRLGLDTVDPTTLRLDMGLGIADGWLGDVPVFRNIYAMLQPDRRPNFDAGLLEVEARDGIARIKKLKVTSPNLQIEGSGTLRYDGYLELKIGFPDLFPEASPLVLLPPLYRALGDSLVVYDIVGYIGNTRTGARFLPFESEPKAVPLAPLPGRVQELPRIFR